MKCTETCNYQPIKDQYHTFINCYQPIRAQYHLFTVPSTDTSHHTGHSVVCQLWSQSPRYELVQTSVITPHPVNQLEISMALHQPIRREYYLGVTRSVRADMASGLVKGGRVVNSDLRVFGSLCS